MHSALPIAFIVGKGLHYQRLSWNDSASGLSLAHLRRSGIKTFRTSDRSAESIPLRPRGRSRIHSTATNATAASAMKLQAPVRLGAPVGLCTTGTAYTALQHTMVIRKLFEWALTVSAGRALS